MKSLFTFLATMATTSLAHMQLQYPPPLRSKYNQFSTDIDWDMTCPLEASGSNYPCKGHLPDLGTRAGSSVVTWSAGSSRNFTVVGDTTHGGGSCQASLSIDGGITFKVIHSYIGSCPLASSYPFKVPSDTPTGLALFAWTWFNKYGNREMYMNCASVTIGVGSGTESTAFHSRPDIFLGNIGNVGNNCRTLENYDVGFPCPGLDTTDNSTAVVPPSCPNKATAIESLSSDATTNTRRFTAPSSNCKTSISHSTSAATQSFTQTLSLNGKCGGSQTCRGSRFGCCCSKYGYCGMTEAHCGEGCNPSFGICNSDSTIDFSSSATAAGTNRTTCNTSLSSTKTSTTAKAAGTTQVSLTTSTSGCTPATTTSTVERIVSVTTTESIITSTSSTSVASALATTSTSTPTSATTSTSATSINKLSTGTTLQANSTESCAPFTGCSNRIPIGYIGYSSISATKCKSKCGENSLCKAYEHGRDRYNSTWCYLLDADASTSVALLSNNTDDPCISYVIYNRSCP